MHQRLLVKHMLVLSIMRDRGEPLWLTDIVDEYESRLSTTTDPGNMYQTMRYLVQQGYVALLPRMQRGEGDKPSPQYSVTKKGLLLLTNTMAQFMTTQELPRYVSAFEPPEQETDDP